MPRIRSIKPEFWADFPTAQLSREARLLYIGLWNFADEHGRLAGDPRLIKGQVFPYDDDLDADAVAGVLGELHDAGKIVRYTDDNAPYLHLPRLDRHQRLEPAKVPSRFPDPPPDGPGRSANEPAQIRADESARRSDESARRSDSQPVDNSSGAADQAKGEVRAQQQIRADESARRADSSALLYVAGSMEQGAGSREQAAAAAARDDHEDLPEPTAAAGGLLPPRVAILRSSLNARRLVVRWDRLTTEQLTEIEDLVELHGDGPLVKTALQAYRPDKPAVFAQAWLDNWRAIPAPGEHLRQLSAPPCQAPGHSGTTQHCAQCASELLAAR